MVGWICDHGMTLPMTGRLTPRFDSCLSQLPEQARVTPGVIKPQKPQIRYATDALPGGDRFIRTVGLQTLGQTEIGARVPAKRARQSDHGVIVVLQLLSNYVIGSAARLFVEDAL